MCPGDYMSKGKGNCRKLKNDWELQDREKKIRGKGAGT